MIPSINTFERMIRQTIKEIGVCHITEAIKYADEFETCNYQIYHMYDSIEIISGLYSLKLFDNSSYTITYIGSSPNRIEEQGTLGMCLHFLVALI